MSAPIPTPEDVELAQAICNLVTQYHDDDFDIILPRLDSPPETACMRVAKLIAARIARHIEPFKKDQDRLDWLDYVNRSINAQHGTVYGWRFSVNHNRAEARLDDCNIPALSVREAIDAAAWGELGAQLKNAATKTQP